jgi:hypothetical protein
MTQEIIEKAIKLINPNASFTISGEDLNTIEWINETTPIAVADIQARLTEAETALVNEKQAKETADATNKASGNQKLLDLGLTQAECTALTGYTPPVAE